MEANMGEITLRFLDRNRGSARTIRVESDQMTTLWFGMQKFLKEMGVEHTTTIGKIVEGGGAMDVTIPLAPDQVVRYLKCVECGSTEKAAGRRGEGRVSRQCKVCKGKLYVVSTPSAK